jgi:Flp pilus assembly protein TadD
MRIVESLFFASLIIVILTACAGPTIAPESNTLSSDVLLRAEPLTGEIDLADLSDVDVLEMSRDMLAFLDDNVTRNHGHTLKLHELLYAVINEGSFGLEYDEITRTAQETFAARLGNCLSFTNMFVAMAREVGIEVTYQEIDIPPIWSLQGDSYMLSRHVNVIVNLGAGKSREVDFNIDDFQSSYYRRLITDQRALAYYYSNIGAEHMQKNDTLEALRYFRKALESDAGLAPAWSNLGTLYSRAGFFKYAEAAYVHALEINPKELVAMSNLGHLYEYLGRAELADWYSKQSHRHRMQNPYYRYDLAHKAFRAKDYDSAIRHLKVSVRKKKSEDTFYFLMGLSYLQKGDESRAHRWLEKAEQVAVDDDLKRGYHSKLEMLLGAH